MSPARLDVMIAESGRMSDIDPPPRAATPFITFAALLRRQRLCRRARADDGVPVGDRAFGTTRSGGHPPRPGLATLAPPPERHAAYHQRWSTCISLARRHQTLPKATTRIWSRVQEDRRGADEPVTADESNEQIRPGRRPVAEALVERRFGPADAGVVKPSQGA